MVLSARAWLGVNTAALPLVYAGCSLAPWVGLARWRTYMMDEWHEREAVALALSWLPSALALIAGVTVVAVQAASVPDGSDAVRTPAWWALAVVVALAGAQVVAEGARLRQRIVWLLGSAAMVVAGLLAIAIAKPANVQAYTVPSGLYLLVAGFSFRRSGGLFGRHMTVHEALMVAGMAMLVLPPARAGWRSGEPGTGSSCWYWAACSSAQV